MKTTRFRQDADYWDRKLANYLHDPPDKALCIPNHEERARIIAQALGGLPSPDRDLYQTADCIASGMDRTCLPGYSADESQSGAVDFRDAPALTHPTGSDGALVLDMSKPIKARETTDAIASIITRDMGDKPGAGGLSDQFSGRHPDLAAARFHYVHHCLRRRLADKDVGGLGGLWHRMPADTRIPDHSIWQHCGLVSALASCIDLSEEHGASILVFSITPVQDFINKARKLRDFWTASLILSWLAFEGMRFVIYQFGSTHIIYPSLIGQPIIDRFLERELRLKWLTREDKPAETAGVATLPNKFVAFVPSGQEESVAERIKNSISTAWKLLGEDTRDKIVSLVSTDDPHLRKQFDRQREGFWNFRWAASPLLGEENEEWLKRLLHRDVWKRPLEFAKHAAAVLSQRGHKSLLGGRESLYGPSHAMAQRMLAAGKSIPIDERAPEPGIKCSMHGDLEILHCDWKSDEDRNPPAATDPFWKEVRKGWKIKSDFKSSERLSSVGLMKRIAYRVCQESPAHPLKPFFRDGQGFPSTTEMAMADWLDRVEKSGLDRLILAVSREWRKVLAQVVHGLEPEGDETEHEIIELEEQKRKAGLEVIRQMDQMKDPLTDEDRYYAILLMDGDRMGRLVNGETLAAAWRSVMHPVLCSRLQEEGFDRVYQDFWKAHLDEPRIIAPAVHAAISEALGDFALYSVPGIMKAHRGKLIYAGGDDVCAILPVSEALEAAREIAEAYNHGFLVFYKDRPGSPEILRDTWTPGPGRLAVHLGKGECISISAGILICHHKKPLSVAMRRAHDDVLKKMAKNEGRRNALAVVLEKRAGGDRSFVTKWEEKPWHELQLQSWGAPDIPMLDHFNAIAEALGRPNASALSTSLVYRLHEFRDGLKAIAETAPQQLVPFIRTQIERSGERSEEDEENAETLACHVAAITARCKVGAARPLIDPEALVIARFIGRLRSRHRLTTGGEQ